MRLTMTLRPDRADLRLGEECLASADPSFPRAAQKQLREAAIQEARKLGNPILVETHGKEGIITLLTVTPEGEFQAARPEDAPAELNLREDSPEEGRVATPLEGATPALPLSGPQAEGEPSGGAPDRGVGEARRNGHEHVIEVPLADLLESASHPVASGQGPDVNPFRSSAMAMGLGRSGAGRPARGPLTIMVANTAGGSGKTPTAIGVLSAIAHRRGGDVALVDLDPTGDLARRLGASPASTILDLLGRLSDPDLPSPTVAELHDLMVYADATKLWAVPARTATVDKRAADGVVQPELSAGEYASVHSGLATAFGVVGIDAGNNDAGRGFLEALKHTQQLLIPLGWDQKTVAAALNLLANIHETGFADLANRAIIIATTPPRIFPNRRQRQRALDTFTSHGLQIMEVPTDLHIHERGAISWERLRPATRKAYTAIADEVLTRAGF
jgi:cellulose biosynthesis protein BcsQ